MKTAATWLDVNAATSIPRAVVAVTYSSVQSVSIHPLPFKGHPEDDDCHEHEYGEIDHADDNVWKLLSHQEFKPPRRGDIKIDDRAQLLFTHDAHRHEDRRDQYQEYGRNAGHDGVNALERRVVGEPRLDLDPRLTGEADRAIAHLLCQEVVINAYDVLAYAFSAVCGCAVDPGDDFTHVCFPNVPAEIGLHLEGDFDLV